MIEPGKSYKTREGLVARVYCNDAKGRWPVHGSYLFLDHWLPIQWSLDGQALAGEKYDLDLTSNQQGDDIDNAALEWEDGEITECCACCEIKKCQKLEDPYLSEIYPKDPCPVDWWCMECWDARHSDI